MQIAEKSPNQIFSQKFVFLMWCFGFLTVFITADSNLLDQLPSSIYLHSIFMANLFHPHFSIYQLIILMMSYVLVMKYQVSVKNAGLSENLVMLATALYIVFLMLNPNNNTLNPILGMPLLSDPSIFVSFIFMITLFTLERTVVITFLRKMVQILLILSVGRATLLLLMWLIGMGNLFFGGVYSSLTEEDTLLIMVLVQLILMLLYFVTREKKYLLFFSIILFLEYTSFRRAGLLLSIISATTFYLYYYIRFAPLKRKMSQLIALLYIFTIIVIANPMRSQKVQLYVARYLGEYINFGGSNQYDYYSANKHFEQSFYGMDIAISQLGFWGSGYGNSSRYSRYNYEGNSGIHNAYFTVWETQGVFALIYFAILIIVIVAWFLKWISNNLDAPPDYLLIKACLFVFILGFMATAWILIVNNLIGLKMVIVRILILAAIFNITPSNYRLLLRGLKDN
jgi:hypothetical protein